METENKELKKRIVELEYENEKLKKNLEIYTLKNKNYYEENKETHKQRVKEYKEKTNYYQNLSAEKKKEYARKAYLNKKSKIKINSTYPDITFFNPSENVVLRINSMKRSKFEPVNVNANGLALEKTQDY